MSGETEDKPSARTPDIVYETTLALLRAERDYTNGQIGIINQRLTDIDKATELLSITVTAVPTDLQRVSGEILRLMDERDHRVRDQFEAIRQLRESQYNLSQQQIKDALIAQKESTGVSYSSLDRTIEKNSQLAAQGTDAISARVTQLQEQINVNQRQIAEILAGKQAVVEQKTDTRGGAGFVFGVVGAVIGLAGFVMAAILAATRLGG